MHLIGPKRHNFTNAPVSHELIDRRSPQRQIESPHLSVSRNASSRAFIQSHSDVPPPINIVCITWNLFGSLPPAQSVAQLVKSQGFQCDPDVIFIGTQQCQRSLCVSFFCEGKYEWEEMLKAALLSYDLVESQAMNGLHSALFIKNHLKKETWIDNNSKLRAGFCNVVGNKGAISMEFQFSGRSFQFINCHLAHQQDKSSKRNQTIIRILEEMVSKNKQTEVILLGDLNYRIDIKMDVYQSMIFQQQNTEKAIHYTALMKAEQLYLQAALKSFLQQFEEGPIRFPPTYKLFIQSEQYDRKRIPGWTDRIFMRRGRMERILYGCEYEIRGSDHRPVVAAFKVEVGSRTSTGFRQSYQEKKCQIM